MPDRWNYPNGSSEFPNHWILQKFDWLTEHVSVLLANQSHNRADMLAHLDRSEKHIHQRLDDLKDEIFARFERVEETQRLQARAPPGPQEPASSLAKSLFGVVGVFLFQTIPWGRIFLLASGAFIGLAGHLMPDRTKAMMKGLMGLWGGS